MNNTIQLGLMLGWQDVKQAYRRSALGQFWITAAMAVQITTMALVFSNIFRADLNSYVPYLAISIVLWNLISSSVTEGCSTFISSEATIKQINLSSNVYLIRMLWKNLVTFAHNFAIIPVVILFFGSKITLSIVLFLPGILVCISTFFGLARLLGTVSARFRDFPQIVSSAMTIAFYITPVMWFPKLVEGTNVAHLLLGLNPFYHLLQICRLPLIGEVPTTENWLISISAMILLNLTGWLIHKKTKNALAYWL